MKATDFAKGIGLGMVAGAAVGMVIAPRRRSKKIIAGKVLRTAGDVLDTVTGSLGM